MSGRKIVLVARGGGSAILHEIGEMQRGSRRREKEVEYYGGGQNNWVRQGGPTIWMLEEVLGGRAETFKKPRRNKERGRREPMG